MPNTYTQIHIQFVFAVKYRKAVIEETWETQLYKYITGIFTHNSHKLLAINGMPDHIHILAGVKPTQAVSDLIKEVKQHSSIWVNDNKFTASKFEWQQGFGAFSYSMSHLDAVIKYIHNQKIHHQKRGFKDEYVDLLQKFNIDYNTNYIFKDLQ